MIYTVAQWLTTVIEAIMFYLLLDTFCLKKDSVPQYLYSGSVVVLSIMIVISNYIFPYTILNILCMIISTFIISFIFDGNIIIRLLISVIGFLLAASMEVATLFVITTVYRVTVTIAIENPTLRLLGIIMSKMVAFAITNMICMISKRNKLRMGKAYWTLFLLVFANSILAVFLLFKLAYESSLTGLNYLLMICSFGLLFSSFFSFYMCERMNKQNEIINREQQYKQQIKSQSKHLDEIMLSQNELRKFKHDLSHHFTTLSGYFADKNYSEGMKYLSDISNIIIVDKGRVKTGNTPFDAIINVKKSLAQNMGIFFETNIQIPGDLHMDAADVCIIFGNALDNAIEACEKVDDKKISVTVTYDNSSIYCKIVNTAIIDEKARRLITHKKDKINHGFGIENIKTALSKYDNIFEIAYGENEFILKFIVFLDK